MKVYKGRKDEEEDVRKYRIILSKEKMLEIESRSPRLRSPETRLGSSYRHVVRQTTCLVMRGNKRCNIRTMYNVILRRVREFLFPSKRNKCYLLVDGCVRACVRECGYPGAWACACEYVHVALLIQHPKDMRHVVTSFVAPRFASDFSTFSHKRRDFRKKGIEHKIRFDFLYNFCLKRFPF